MRSFNLVEMSLLWLEKTTVVPWYISSNYYFYFTRYAGQVGYILANMKNIDDALVGDTIYHQCKPTEPMPGFKPAKPMVRLATFIIYGL